MSDIDKRSLTERDICTKFITPALRDAGWDEMHQTGCRAIRYGIQSCADPDRRPSGSRSVRASDLARTSGWTSGRTPSVDKLIDVGELSMQ